ncbi:TPA: hypothetical protein ACK3SM_003302 [Burkholderia cepacia]
MPELNRRVCAGDCRGVQACAEAAHVKPGKPRSRDSMEGCAIVPSEPSSLVGLAIAAACADRAVGERHGENARIVAGKAGRQPIRYAFFLRCRDRVQAKRADDWPGITRPATRRAEPAS